MRKKLAVMLAAALTACCLGACGGSDNSGTEAGVSSTGESSVASSSQTKEAETGSEKKDEKADSEKVILVVSFGTSYNDSRDITIGAVEEAIQKACPDYEVRRAFTSQIIIDKLKDRDKLEIDNVEEALDRAVSDGVKELVVQPTHLMDGYEYTDLAEALTDYIGKFDKLILGNPLLMSDADFDAVMKAITEKTAEYDDGETAICFMGHGTEAESNGIYAKFQESLTKAGYENYFIGTVEATPSIDDVVEALKKKGTYKKVVLEPLMVVAGDHANNDMAGDEEDSWKTILEKEGFEVTCLIEGLGQIPAVQDIYVEHVKAAISADKAFIGIEKKEDKSAAGELTDGTYSIDVESDSSMFKVEKAALTIENGEMTAVITLSGTGYSKLYMGTAEAAAKAAEEDCIPFVEDADGAYTYTIPVAGLNVPIDVAAFSKKKEEWYDRALTFSSASIKTEGDDGGNGVENADGGTASNGGNVNIAEVSDGTYTMEVVLGGGSGKSTITSPATIKAEGGKVTASIEWSSSNYDYMLVDGEKYLPVNTEGNSVFEIPVSAFDTELTVIGDTVAMSKPHEVEYTLLFKSDTLKAAQ